LIAAKLLHSYSRLKPKRRIDPQVSEGEPINEHVGGRYISRRQ
jgi:hypothetical protein